MIVKNRIGTGKDLKKACESYNEKILKNVIEYAIDKLTDVIEGKTKSVTVADLLEYRTILILFHIHRFKTDYDLKSKKEVEIK